MPRLLLDLRKEIMQNLKNPEDERRWKIINEVLYARGFVEPITREPRVIPRLVRSLYRSVFGPPDWYNGHFGFRINFADMQRMYMRVLQDRLIKIALSIQFDEDKGIKAGTPTMIGPALDEYGQSAL